MSNDMGWIKTDDGDRLTLCNLMHLLVFEGGGVWFYQIIAWDYPEDAIISQFQAPAEAEAKQAGLEAALAMADRVRETALGELRRIKQAAQDADDAALVAPVDPAWLVHDAGWAVLHAAVVAGHRCLVSIYPDGHVKWELEPEHYGHPLTWDAPDLETAKIRAAAAALREPCKLWRVVLPPQGQGICRLDGGEVDVWAATREGALYRAAQAISGDCIGVLGEIEGEAVEVAG